MKGKKGNKRKKGKKKKGGKKRKKRTNPPSEYLKHQSPQSLPIKSGDPRSPFFPLPFMYSVVVSPLI